MSARRPDLSDRLRLMVVTDARLARPRSVDAVVEAALSGGATAIQLRNKGDPARDLVALGRRLRELTRRRGALLIVNDRMDVALVLDADGVHVGPDDLPVAALRRGAPHGFLIGRSADLPDTARAAVADGADYIGCGAVFGSTTKDVGDEAIGPAGLDAVARAVDVPVLAIGGISPANVADVQNTAAAGVAVVGAVMGAADPEDAARRLVRAMGRGRRGR